MSERLRLDDFQDQEASKHRKFGSSGHCEDYKEAFRELTHSDLLLIQLKALERFHKQEVQFLQQQLDKANKWVSVESSYPMTYERGNWDGERSDFVIVELKNGLFSVVRYYHGFMDGTEFHYWVTSDDYEEEQIIKWKYIN